MTVLICLTRGREGEKERKKASLRSLLACNRLSGRRSHPGLKPRLAWRWPPVPTRAALLLHGWKSCPRSCSSSSRSLLPSSPPLSPPPCAPPPPSFAVMLPGSLACAFALPLPSAPAPASCPFFFCHSPLRRRGGDAEQQDACQRRGEVGKTWEECGSPTFAFAPFLAAPGLRFPHPPGPCSAAGPSGDGGRRRGRRAPASRGREPGRPEPHARPSPALRLLRPSRSSHMHTFKPAPPSSLDPAPAQRAEGPTHPAKGRGSGVMSPPPSPPALAPPPPTPAPRAPGQLVPAPVAFRSRLSAPLSPGSVWAPFFLL